MASIIHHRQTMNSITKEDIAKRIDHTLLKVVRRGVVSWIQAFATEKDIAKLCDDADKYHFASVCVNPM